MKTTYLVYISLFVLAFAGCEQIIDPNDKNFETELFVYGLVGPGELPKIFITETQANEGWFEQIAEVGFPKGLDIDISAQGQSQTLIEKEGWNVFYNYISREIDTSFNVFYEGNTPLPDSGSYQLNFQYQGQEIKASTQIPAKVAIDTAYSKVIKYEDSGGSWQENVLAVEFTDRVGSTEAYRLQLGYSGFKRQAHFDADGQFLGVWDTIAVNANHYYHSISDQGLEGQKILSTLSPYINMIPNIETLPDGSSRRYYLVWIVLETQSDALRIFIESAEAQRYSNGDPFVEPVFLKGNVEGAQGVFAAYQKSDTVWARYYP